MCACQDTNNLFLFVIIFRYNDSVSYGELFLQNEYEMSVYNLEKADVAGQRQRCV